MAQALTNTGIWFGGYDLSGKLRGVSLSYGANMGDSTVFGSLTRKSQPTNRRVRSQVEGLWEAATSGGAPDSILYSNIGEVDVPYSFAPARATGTTAFTYLAAKATYTFGGEVGSLLPFSSAAEASGDPGLVMGQLILDGSSLSSSGAGTKFQVGAVAAGKRMYAALHVLNAGTGTFDGVLQSDADSSSGGETNRITFSQASAVSSQWSSVAGAITDTWWRLSYTIAGGAPSFSVVCVIGVI